MRQGVIRGEGMRREESKSKSHYVPGAGYWSVLSDSEVSLKHLKAKKGHGQTHMLETQLCW